MTYVLAREVAAITHELDQKVADDLDLTTFEIAIIAQRMRLVERLAIAQEKELEVHRLGEANRTGRAIVDKLASDAMASLVHDPEGKIITPDFGRKG